MPGRFRAWCWTLNNYSQNELQHLRNLHVSPENGEGHDNEDSQGESTEEPRAAQSRIRFIIFQPERGEQGTRHLQGYVVLRHPGTLAGIKKLLSPSGAGRAHLESARGSLEQNVQYCSKPDGRDTWSPVVEGEACDFSGMSIPYSLGDRSGLEGTGRGSGSRSDIAAAAQSILDGATPTEVARAHPKTFIMYSRGIAALSAACSKRRDPSTAPTIYWVHGPTGTGKSRWCYEQSPDAYWKSTEHFWWDGYDGVSDVIIDDYRADFCKFHILLNLLDRYPCQVQIKGGTLQFNARTIYITCPSHPTVVWASRTSEDMNQLLRRITEIKYIGPDPTSVVPGFVPCN